jgi:hypothetical protein
MMTRLEQVHKRVEITRDVLISLGIIVGGIWALLLAGQESIFSPRVISETWAEHHVLQDGRALLRVHVEMRNPGTKRMTIDKVTVVVNDANASDPHALKEAPDGPLDWVEATTTGEFRMLGRVSTPDSWSATIEPGDVEPAMFSFLVRERTKVVSIYVKCKGQAGNYQFYRLEGTPPPGGQPRDEGGQ